MDIVKQLRKHGHHAWADEVQQLITRNEKLASAIDDTDEDLENAREEIQSLQNKLKAVRFKAKNIENSVAAILSSLGDN